ncbi:MAG: uridine diphosphate-N-acetylglucosamine-binding protein YvcK [Actinobacteria bacterium]|nr:uridine diphosphate-N-acetylglucosamine-binding protein YvcK [Actinomycetota bacterium]
MSGDGRRVVAIGGGHGLSRVLAACRHLGLAPTAVVTVADDGGSSGRLRRDLGIIALGDLRMALLALARNEALADALAHRFERGHLQGHALGNLLLVAMTEAADGDVLRALRRAETLLECDGAVLPSTTAPVHIAARVSGNRLSGQANITQSGGRLESIWLEPDDPPACAEAVDAVRRADVVVLGPGSLFTSVVVNLLVTDLCRAVCETDALLVHVANVQAPPGETSQLALRDHVDVLNSTLGGRRIDVVVVHQGPRPPGPGTPLAPLAPLPGGPRVVAADLLHRDHDDRLRPAHDPARLAEALRRAMAPMPAPWGAGAT